MLQLVKSDSATYKKAQRVPIFGFGEREENKEANLSGSCGSGLAIKWPLQICESSASLLTPTSKSCIFNSRSIPDLGLSNELYRSGVTEKAFVNVSVQLGKMQPYLL